ncbi:hypothetical protein Nepgr_011598 [Nepenthes gracilis]|uniref:Uncharacterized protein n=1 Tax=Nepenthes gracilis TaxID=150966 RepID=A0AAD3SEQ0_NEPGR|nr:hypothetical protein Nepgr_011598 [Nepenthes gracilis]
MAPLPSKIRIKSDENESATAIEIVVDYQGKPKHHGNGRPASQKSTSKVPFSLDGHQAGNNSQNLILNHAVTTAESKASNDIKKVPVDPIPISPKAKMEILGACAASGEYSTYGPGPVSSSPLAEADAPSALGTVCSTTGSIGTPRPNVAIISSLSDVSGREIYADGASHEEVVVTQMGSLPSAELDGKCYVVPVTKEHDVSRIFSGSNLQPLELLPADGVPTGCSEEGSSEEAYSESGDDVSSDHPMLDVAVPLVGVHDAGSFPGPHAAPPDHQGDPLPPKIRLLTGATESAQTVEVEVIYHSEPVRSSSGSLFSRKHVANRLPMARTSGVKRMGAISPIALASVNARGGNPSDGVVKSPVGVKPPVLAHDAVYVLADSVLGYNNAPSGEVGGSTGSLESLVGAHHVLNSSLDHSDGSLVGLPSFNVNDTSREAHQPPLYLLIWLPNRFRVIVADTISTTCNSTIPAYSQLNKQPYAQATYSASPATCVHHKSADAIRGPGLDPDQPSVVAEDERLGECSYSADSELPDLEACLGVMDFLSRCCYVQQPKMVLWALVLEHSAVLRATSLLCHGELPNLCTALLEHSDATVRCHGLTCWSILLEQSADACYVRRYYVSSSRTMPYSLPQLASGNLVMKGVMSLFRIGAVSENCLDAGRDLMLIAVAGKGWIIAAAVKLPLPCRSSWWYRICPLCNVVSSKDRSVLLEDRCLIAVSLDMICCKSLLAAKCYSPRNAQRFALGHDLSVAVGLLSANNLLRQSQGAACVEVHTPSQQDCIPTLAVGITGQSSRAAIIAENRARDHLSTLQQEVLEERFHEKIHTSAKEPLQ